MKLEHFKKESECYKISKLDERKKKMSLVVENTERLDRHRQAFRQMAYDSTEKAEKYKAEKEALEQELELCRATWALDDAEVDMLNSIFSSADLQKDEDQVTAYENENPQFFAPQNSKKKQKTPKN